MSQRVTDDIVRSWLLWARNFGEIVAYHVGSGSARRFRVRLTPGITCDGTPFRPRQGMLDIFGHTANDIVPAEMMLTAREALLFGMGCAVGRTSALVGVEHDWQQEQQDAWTPQVQAEFLERRKEAREANKVDLDRESAEREAERQRRIAEYRRRKETTT